MDISTDRVFVQAVATIKSLTDLSKTTGLPRPSISDRLNLYGLYNQSTRGDITTLNTDLNVITNPTELKKYNAWLKFKGLSKTQARNKYIVYLLNILNNEYSNIEYPDLVLLKANLQDSWNMLEEYNERINVAKQPIQPRIPLSLNSTPLPPALDNMSFASVVAPITVVPTADNESDANIISIVTSRTPSTITNNTIQQANNNHVNIPRMHSPAASLYRIASSGINSNIIKPPSRNQSIRSRQNSIGAPSTITATTLQPSTMNQSMQANITTATNMTASNVSSGNVSVMEFVKWQGEINNTLLKISTELSNLKMHNNNVGIPDPHRSISGSTTVSVQSDIQNYKLRNYDNEYSPKYYNDCKKLRMNSVEHNCNPSRFNDEPNNDREGVMKWVYMNMIRMVKYLKENVSVRINIGSVTNRLVTSIVALLFLSVFKRVIDIYFKKRFGVNLGTSSSGKSLVQHWKQWMIGMLSGKSGASVLTE